MVPMAGGSVLAVYEPGEGCGGGGGACVERACGIEVEKGSAGGYLKCEAGYVVEGGVARSGCRSAGVVGAGVASPSPKAVETTVAATTTTAKAKVEATTRAAVGLKRRDVEEEEEVVKKDKVGDEDEVVKKDKVEEKDGLVVVDEEDGEEETIVDEDVAVVEDAAGDEEEGELEVPKAGGVPGPARTDKMETDAVACFPAAATVLLDTGATARMDALSVGDRVSVGRGAFSPVFMFTHAAAGARADFVRLHTAAGARVDLTPGHYLYVGGALVPAREVRVGDAVEGGDGGEDVVVAVERVKGVGLFNPQTLQGDVVVGGVRASTYTTAVAPGVAHGLLWPLRVVYEAVGGYTRWLEAGAPSALVGLAPRGGEVC